MTKQPVGTVTFLFTDIEGSTQLWDRYPEAMRAALTRHDALLREAIEAHSGYIFKTVGDAFCAAFATASDALAAALAAQRSLQSETWGEAPIKVRMALHTGTAEARENDYFGPPLNRVARLLDAGYGEQILLSQTTEKLLRDRLPDRLELRDKGKRRLKDLVDPEHIFQVIVPDLPSNLPPLKTLDYRPNNLPAQTTSFVGREAELAAIPKILLRAEVRLLTLTGPGGTGKTRLAQQVAANMLDDFGNGVFFIALGSITDPALVIVTIAQTLGVVDAQDRPLQTLLEDHLQDRQVLLLLDNFEQVADAAPVVSGLLAAAPRLKILATSRVLLQVYGEHEYSVPVLSLPDPKQTLPLERLIQYETVQLFVERARAVKSDFTVTDENALSVTEICHRLDGLPLAIELAAARVRLLPPKKMSAQLEQGLHFLASRTRDLPPRQRTLRNTIEWSYDLLDEKERALFRRLAVFVGGCTLEGAEAVCSLQGDLDVLDGLESLMSQSLLKTSDLKKEPRYEMLEIIREYALERLGESKEAKAVRRQHADYFARLAEEAEPKLRGGEQKTWLDRLEAETGNLRVALGWTFEGEEVGLGLRLAAALAPFWAVRGRPMEWNKWLEKALEESQASSPRMRAKILLAVGRLHAHHGDPDQARAFLQEGLTLSQQLGDNRGAAYALCDLGEAYRESGDHRQATELLEQSLSLFQELGDKAGAWSALLILGILARKAGDYARSAALFEGSLVLARELEDRWYIAHTLQGLGNLALEQKDFWQAAALYHQGLILYSELNDRAGMVESLNRLGEVTCSWGDGERAARLLGAAEALSQAAGVHLFRPHDQAKYRHNVTAVRAQLDEATFAAAWARGRAMTVEEVIAYTMEGMVD